MKAVNIMNFARCIDERFEDKDKIQFETTKAELRLVNEFDLENTFLLQYDTFCDERYVRLFKEEATDKTELGLWYEIVEPLTTACGLPYESEMGWKWDWHIIPGFSMAYTPEQRELLIDEAMRKFKQVFGYYPRTVASWVIDTHTVRYLCENYEIDAIGICRDQTSTDAYTLVGGYFNQAYYPSKYNVFTPAQSKENQINVPVFRLLAPCPVHNYDNRKYISEQMNGMLGRGGCFTLEPVWKTGNTPEIVDWFFKTYFENEDLGFSYAQLGQENSFGATHNFLPALRMQLEKLKSVKGITVSKMGDTGAWFKQAYSELTPATAVTATDSWDKGADAQSVYYDCKNYVTNLFRFEQKVFIRALYLFDERIKDNYLTEKCTTFDAIYENLPIVDTLFSPASDKKSFGLVIDDNASSIEVSKCGESSLRAVFGERSVIFTEDKIEITSPQAILYFNDARYRITLSEGTLSYRYKENEYRLDVIGADVEVADDGFRFHSKRGTFTLIPRRS